MAKTSWWTARGKHLLYLMAALGMVFYALMRLEEGGAGAYFRLFWYSWLGFAAVIVAANVNMLLFVSEEKRRELARIKRAKRLNLERSLERRLAGGEKAKRIVRGRQ
ncbi:hypothetical protein [Paenibacillus sp. PL2-23]|uniref:hypothetical protein n=1 Tax=Paenibacillus sp. PL2-23 TaxID=2100729 RepID=UPI0030F60E02